MFENLSEEERVDKLIGLEMQMEDLIEELYRETDSARMLTLLSHIEAIENVIRMIDMRYDDDDNQRERNQADVV